jgi:Carboxypeptidase regulatory-like domain
LVTLVILSLFPIRAYAQVSGGMLSGTVTDASGTPIPNAQVSVNSLATGATRRVKTDTAGFYTVPNLPTGSYDLTVAMAGFSTQARTGIAVAVGDRLVLNVAMKAGSPSQ